MAAAAVDLKSLEPEVSELGLDASAYSDKELEFMTKMAGHRRKYKTRGKIDKVRH